MATFVVLSAVAGVVEVGLPVNARDASGANIVLMFAPLKFRYEVALMVVACIVPVAVMFVAVAVAVKAGEASGA